MAGRFINRVARTLFAGRLRAIERFRERPIEVQAEVLRRLVRCGCVTEYGRGWGMRPDMTAGQFARRVPLCEYDDVAARMEAVRRGGRNPFWPERVLRFARSSGTTSQRSKYIPVTGASLREAHMRGPRDVMALYCDRHPDTGVLGGKMLTLGGSQRLDAADDLIPSGDLSSIMIEHTPFWAWSFRVPDRKTALLDDFDRKTELICRLATRMDVRSFAGVPSWNLVLLHRVMERAGVDGVARVWPRLELFVHGGMNFAPYHEEYRRITRPLEMRFWQTYNASEGFFAIAERADDEDMLLMLDYGTYYEFLPVRSDNAAASVVPLEGVRCGEEYEMIISSSGGLWRYRPGDTVEFTSLSPYKVRFAGRTKLFVNAFGEELGVGQAERAVERACRVARCGVAEYTVAPLFMAPGGRGRHEWAVEFGEEPSSMELFAEELDRTLRLLNSDYDAKRNADHTLLPPRILPLSRGTFRRWMGECGRLGGQNKVPHLCNDRRVMESLLRSAGLSERCDAQKEDECL